MRITSAEAAGSPRDLGSGQAAWAARRSPANQGSGALFQAALASAMGTVNTCIAERDNRRAAERSLGADTYRLAGNLENLELGYRLPS